MQRELYVEVHPSDDFEGEDISVKLHGRLVFGAYRFDGGTDYASTFWPVNANRTKDQHFERLLAFFDSVRNGNYEARDEEKILPSGILIFQTGSTERQMIPLDQLEVLASDRRFEDFSFLRIDSPYFAFTMEDYSGTAWKPDTGRFGVLTEQDLSVPVAAFIADTCRFHVPAEQLQPILAEKVYCWPAQRVR